LRLSLAADHRSDAQSIEIAAAPEKWREAANLPSGLSTNLCCSQDTRDPAPPGKTALRLNFAPADRDQSRTTF